MQRKVWKATQTCIVVTGVVITDTGLRDGEESSCPGVQAVFLVMCYLGLWRDWPQILPLPSRRCQSGWGGWVPDHNFLYTPLPPPPILSDSVGPGMEPLSAFLQRLSRTHRVPEASSVPHTQTTPSPLEHLPSRILIGVLLSNFSKLFSSVNWLFIWICGNLRVGTTDE